MFQLQAHIERRMLAAHGLVEAHACARAFLTQNPGFVAQLVQAGLATRGKRMLGRAEDHQFIFHPGLHFYIGVMAFAFDQAQIQFIVGNLVHDLRGIVHMQRHSALRVALHEDAQQQSRQIVAHGQCGAHLQ
ncbi:hypothetical protein D3C77_572380 [compost metagenome]